MTRLNFRCTPQLRSRIVTLARRSGMSLSAYQREVLVRHMKLSRGAEKRKFLSDGVGNGYGTWGAVMDGANPSEELAEEIRKRAGVLGLKVGGYLRLVFEKHVEDEKERKKR